MGLYIKWNKTFQISECDATLERSFPCVNRNLIYRNVFDNYSELKYDRSHEKRARSCSRLERSGDGRQYGTGVRLRKLAESLLLNDTFHGARHGVLRALVNEVGESCNLTALSGSEVMYLDRVETPAPLRFYLHSGSRVPVHCSASGKLFLAGMTPSQRQRLLAHAPLEAFTPKTLTDLDALEEEIKQVKRQGFALDNEEFLPGLMCVAVLVPSPSGRSNLCVAVQAPIMRLTPDKALGLLPALQRAADAFSRIENDASDPLDDGASA